MTTSPVDTRSTQMQMQAQQVQSQARDVGNLLKSGGKHGAQKEKKLREACEGFESIFIQKMWQQMRATLPKTNMLQGKEEQYWQSMYDQELAKSMAGAGGIGLADMMYEQLSRDLVSASRTTASATQQRGGGFAVSAAPLMGPETGGKQTAELGTGKAGQALGQNSGAPGKPGKGQDMYSGAAPQPEAVVTAAVPAVSVDGTVATEGEGAPVVQQFLAELRQRQVRQSGQAGQDGPGGQDIQSGQSANGAVPGAVHAEGVTVAQHSLQQGRGGMTLAQRAQMEAANKPAANGVMPAMPAQRGARLTPPPAPQPVAVGAQAAPVEHTSYAEQGAQAIFVPPAQAAQQSGSPQTAQQVAGAAGQQSGAAIAAAVPQATVAQAQAAMQRSAPVAAQAQAFAAQATAPVTAPLTAAEQQPQVVNTTFTTNIPPKNRRTPRPRGQRLPSGQPAIRTLGAPAPASPIASGAQHMNPAAQNSPAQAVSGQTVPGQHTPAAATPAGMTVPGTGPQAAMQQGQQGQQGPQGAPASMQIEG